MKRLVSLILAISFFSILFYSGCKDTITAEQIDSVVIPSSNVSYSKYIQPVLNLKCATAGCHDDITIAGGYSMTTWANTTNPQFVTKGVPENSQLVQAIDPKYGGVFKMPPIDSGVLPMTANQVQGVETWIKEGAKPN